MSEHSYHLDDIVVVTGAGSGIGRAASLSYATRGAYVIVTDRDMSTAADTVDLIVSAGGAGEASRLDVTDPDAWTALLNDVESRRGTPRIVVNNAGYTTAGSFLEHSADDWESLVAVNLRGVVTGSRLSAQRMIAAGVHGQIVNVASAAAYTPVTVSTPYCTTKAAVLMFSETLRIELKRHGIGVTAICPGAINTEFYRSARHLDRNEDRKQLSVQAVSKFGTSPTTVGEAIVRAAEHDRAVQPVTAEAYAGYALSRVSPTLMRVVTRLSGDNMVRKLEHRPFVKRLLGGSR